MCDINTDIKLAERSLRQSVDTKPSLVQIADTSCESTETSTWASELGPTPSPTKPTQLSLHDAHQPHHTTRHVTFSEYVDSVELPCDEDEPPKKGNKISSSSPHKTSLVDLLKDAAKRRAAFDKAYDELPAHLRGWNDNV